MHEEEEFFNSFIKCVFFFIFLFQMSKEISWKLVTNIVSHVLQLTNHNARNSSNILQMCHGTLAAYYFRFFSRICFTTSLYLPEYSHIFTAWVFPTCLSIPASSLLWSAGDLKEPTYSSLRVGHEVSPVLWSGLYPLYRCTAEMLGDISSVRATL